MEDDLSRWELELASTINITKAPETDKLMVEIRLDGEDFGFVRQTNGGFDIVILNCESGDRWSVEFAELMTVFARAKQRLMG